MTGRRQSFGRAAPAPDGAPLGFDWFCFVCTVCADEVVVGREPSQTVEDFALMCEWLYGDPPVCSVCLSFDNAA